MSEFQQVISLDSLKAGEPTPVRLGGRQLALHLVDGVPYCTDDICTHEECLLSDGGVLDGEEVECPMHGARFNVKTGEVTAAPAVDPLPTFPVEVRDGQVWVSLK